MILFALSAIAALLAVFHIARDIVVRLRCGTFWNGLAYEALPQATWQGLQLAAWLLIAGAMLDG